MVPFHSGEQMPCGIFFRDNGDYYNFLFENAASSVVVQETVVESYRSLIISNLSVSN